MPYRHLNLVAGQADVNSPITLDLVKGRERTFLEHFWQTLSANPKAFSETERKTYAKSYAQEGAMRAAFEYFKAFNKQVAEDNRKFAGRPIGTWWRVRLGAGVKKRQRFASEV